MPRKQKLSHLQISLDKMNSPCIKPSLGYQSQEKVIHRQNETSDAIQHVSPTMKLPRPINFESGSKGAKLRAAEIGP